MLSSHLFLCLPRLLPSFTVTCKMVLSRPGERETRPYHCSLRLFTMFRSSSCGPIARWILARTSSLVTWSLYEMCSILRQHLMRIQCVLDHMSVYTKTAAFTSHEDSTVGLIGITILAAPRLKQKMTEIIAEGIGRNSRQRVNRCAHSIIH